MDPNLQIWIHAHHIFLHALLFTLAGIFDQNRGIFLRASWIQICKFRKKFLHAHHIFSPRLLFTLAGIWDQNRGVVFTVFDKRLRVLPNMERRARVDHESGRISVKFYVDGPFSGSIAGSRLAGLYRESKGNPVFRESHSGRRIYEFTKFVTHAQRIFTPRLLFSG